MARADVNGSSHIKLQYVLKVPLKISFTGVRLDLIRE